MLTLFVFGILVSLFVGACLAEPKHEERRARTAEDYEAIYAWYRSTHVEQG